MNFMSCGGVISNCNLWRSINHCTLACAFAHAGAFKAMGRMAKGRHPARVDSMEWSVNPSDEGGARES